MARLSRLAAASFCATLCMTAPAMAQSLIAQPSAADVALAYPDRALADGANGAVTVACVIGAAGFLDDCSVAAETPAGYGFGDAALNLMRHFRYAALTPDGQRSQGLHKRLIVRFSPPETSASAPASRDPRP